VVGDPSTRDPFVPGARVAAPWGLDVLEGTVVDSHGEGSARRVMVSVELPDTGDDPETQLVAYRASDLEAAARVADERQPGAWMQAYKYEEQLSETLKRLTETAQLLNSSLERPIRAVDSEADFTLDADGRKLLIEAKTLSPDKAISRDTIDRLLDLLLSSHASGALLVTNRRLSRAAAEVLQEAILNGLSIRAVHWEPSGDSAELGRAIHELTAAA
jgi:hypothetical protein